MFLLPETEYEYRVSVNDLNSEPYTFTSSSLPEGIPIYELTKDDGGPDKGFIMQMQPSTPGYLTVCDMQGRIVWYEIFDQPVRCAHYNPKAGKIAVLAGSKAGAEGALSQAIASNIIVMDWNGTRTIDWQAGESTAEYPHHEIKLTDEGNILLNNYVPRHFNLTTVGGTADTEVWGDGITLLSPTGEKLFTWDIFSELDLIKEADYLYPATNAKDLVHQNSASMDADGNFYVTSHWLTEIWEIDGKSGKVIYRLGEHGNVKLDKPFADGGFHSGIPLAPDKILVLNNGKGKGVCPKALVYEIDSENLTAKCTMDVTFEEQYASTTRGNVEILPDGETLHYSSGQAQCCVFTGMDGKALKVISRPGISYRAFYFPDLP